MIYQLHHVTRYDYASMVTLCHSEARLLPRALPWQRCEPSRVSIVPTPATRVQRVDAFGNQLLYFSLEEPHAALEVAVSTRLESGPRPAPVDDRRDWRQAWLPPVDQADALMVRMMTLDSAFVRRSQALADYARASFGAGVTALEGVLALNRRVFEEFTYDPDFTTLATPLDEVLESRRGVCQDFAHLMIGCLRSLGFAARYVSGYLETQPAPGTPKLVGADASHAWLAVYLPNSGWLELDPTNGSLPAERHLINAWGRDYADVAPLKGVMSGGGEQRLSVAVDVLPVGIDSVRES